MNAKARDHATWNVATPTDAQVHDALVIGGGLAGSSLAIRLARSGRSVALLEKSAAAHHKVCGEFLSHEALHYLSGLGLDLPGLGAVPIEAVRLAGKRVFAATRLPFPALSLSRERLDEALLDRAAQAGVCLLRRRRVRSLERSGERWEAKTDAGETIQATDGFLATGKHDLYGWNRPGGRQNDLLAFKMYWRLKPTQQSALDRHVELILFPGGYAGLQPVEDGKSNLCLLVERDSFRRIGGNWLALLAHMTNHAGHLAARLEGAAALWERPLSLSSIPYGYVRVEAEDGLWRLGDQSAVISSFAGDGMSIALHSASLAAGLYLAGRNPQQYQRRLAADVRGQVGLSTLLSRSLVNPRLRRMIEALAHLWPGMLACVAGSTRIRAASLGL